MRFRRLVEPLPVWAALVVGVLTGLVVYLFDPDLLIVALCAGGFALLAGALRR